jgi:hypothetical protein
MKNKYMALMLAIMILGTVAITPVSGITCVKNYYNPFTQKYVCVENTDGTYVEVWNRDKPNFSSYTDRKLLVLGKKGIYTAQQIDNCIKSCAFSFAGCTIVFALDAPVGSACYAIAIDNCQSECTQSAINIGINYLQ